ncbi:MAG: response regulator transcription factor [Butyricicoccus pullicaecorum]|nr:response regulator transcription factor [Butyricicoccus pullicaecorum]MDO4668898.1 response regulator transcription factor [Butyricicoccus pullicaecorum]
MKRKVLVLEDEENIRSFVVLNLKRAGFEVIEADTGEQALELFAQNMDILVAVLDVMLPGIDGYEVCRSIRAHGSRAGIIMLTARTQESDKVTGLMTGADDYVTKPFSVVELVARVEALVRRVAGSGFQEDDSLRSGPFRLDTRAREVTKNGIKIELTQIEYGILKAFMSNVDRALSRDDILEMVWGHHFVGELKIVDVNIRRLRIKIEDNPASPRYIVTVRGYGYMWEGKV